MKLAELFTNNYEYLNTVAKRITRRKDQGLAPDLLNSTYLTIYEKHEKGMFVPTENEEFVKWFSKCLKNYFTWPNSEFNKTYSLSGVSIDSQFRTNNSIKGADYLKEHNSADRFDEMLVDEDSLRDIEISVEQANDFTKELIEISSSLGKAKTLKYIELVDFKRTLPPYEVILFELYFEKELSTRKIADLYSIDGNTMNYQSVNGMVNKIKNKIKEYQWTQ